MMNQLLFAGAVLAYLGAMHWAFKPLREYSETVRERQRQDGKEKPHKPKLVRS